MYDPKQLYIDPVLSNFSVGYQDQELVGTKIFPETPVNTKSGTYRVFDRSNWLIRDDLREPGTVANEVAGRKWSSDTFNIHEHSLQSPVFDEERADLSSLGGLANPVFGGALQIDPERDAVQDITRSLLLKQEKLVADTVRNTATYPANHYMTLSGTSQWDNWTATPPALPASDPIANIKTAMQRIYKDTGGRMPNTIVMSWDVWFKFYDHPRIIDRFKYYQLTLGSDDAAFKQLTGFDGDFYLAQSMYNAADNVDATENITQLWGQDVWIGIVDPQPGMSTKTFGKTFEMPYANGGTRPVDRWREEPRKADLFRVSWQYDIKVVSNVAGYLIQNAVAPLP